MKTPEENRFFDDLLRNYKVIINSPFDSEAFRHELLIVPFLNSKHGLGWKKEELIPQVNIVVSENIRGSYFWKNGMPKKRIPDITVIPNLIKKPIISIEEKKHVKSLSELLKHLFQLKEYQLLQGTVWGILTNGEKWILQRNLETILTINGIGELRDKTEEFKYYVGSDEVLNRFKKTKLTDVIKVYSPYEVTFVDTFESKLIIKDVENIINRRDEDSLKFMKNWDINLNEITKELPHNKNSIKYILEEVEFYMYRRMESFEGYLNAYENTREDDVRLKEIILQKIEKSCTAWFSVYKATFKEFIKLKNNEISIKVFNVNLMDELKFIHMSYQRRPDNNR